MAPGGNLMFYNARPHAFHCPIATTAFVVIDMQRDFLGPDGFESIASGNPVTFSSVRNIVSNVQRALEAARSIGMHVFFTREGYLPNLSDLPAAKKLRQVTAPNGSRFLGIGGEGPMGKLLVRGEKGHDIIDELKPHAREPIIDKPGKGSFWGTEFHRLLLARGITHLILAGVTTECSVTSTLREANDRGYECCVLSDCAAGFDERMAATSLDIVCCRNGLFGYVGQSSEFVMQVEQTRQHIPSSADYDSSSPMLPSIDQLKSLYRDGRITPEDIIQSVFDRIANYDLINPAVWISIQPRESVLEAARKLSAAYAGKPLPPLFGIPFAIKDNIDVEGLVTTAACESYAYTATSTAPSIQHLLDAGALYIGKLNLEQLATGLVGCRSPYGDLHSFHSKYHVPGGSSSGSAVAVAAGLVSFAIGTDTAGSVRAPAALNGVVGFKPTRGTISARGAVPACQSLDTIGVLAPTVADARQVWYVLDCQDPLDPYAKPPASLPTWSVDFRGPKQGSFTFGVPPDSSLQLCSKEYQEIFKQSVNTLQALGGTFVDIDYTPFATAGDLIYGASLIHERLASIGYEFLSEKIDTLHPTTKLVIQKVLSSDLKGWEIYRDQAIQMECTARGRQIFNKFEGGIDVLVVPTVPWHPTIKEIQDDPLTPNSKLGIFTHPANVIDLCGVGVNAGWVNNGGVRLPFGITFQGGSGYDGKVLDIAAVFEKHMGEKQGLN
ncbi:amidase signature domain-containing protein [Trichoderma austrokoningii]